MKSTENQRVEWKETWRDEYLRWVCGFANARGGVLIIGRNNQGRTLGIKNARILLEELPNKIRDLLGVIAEVNLIQDDGKELLEIEVEAYQNPISYRGRYYIRSGSTLQELKGSALNRFLLHTQGRTWDGVPLPLLSLEKLSIPALNTFRTLSAQSGRVDPAVLKSRTPI